MIQSQPVWSNHGQYDPITASMIQSQPVWSNHSQYDPITASMIQTANSTTRLLHYFCIGRQCDDDPFSLSSENWDEAQSEMENKHNGEGKNGKQPFPQKYDMNAAMMPTMLI